MATLCVRASATANPNHHRHGNRNDAVTRASVRLHALRQRASAAARTSPGASLCRHAGALSIAACRWRYAA
eukprot:6187958-Pleurochrysis_carterae.AAC.1